MFYIKAMDTNENTVCHVLFFIQHAVSVILK